MCKYELNEDVLFGKSPVNEVIERIAVQRAKHLEDAILGEIHEIIKENEHLTVVNLNEKAIVKALEKQIRKRPKIKKFAKLKMFELRCPNDDCGAVLQSDSPCCKYCGQTLDWSDTQCE